MKYRIFDTEAEAVAAEAAISASMGYAKPGVNALTGEIVPDVLTLRWAIPQEAVSGQWVFPSPDDNGVEYDPAWFPAPEVGLE